MEGDSARAAKSTLPLQLSIREDPVTRPRHPSWEDPFPGVHGISGHLDTSQAKANDDGNQGEPKTIWRCVPCKKQSLSSCPQDPPKQYGCRPNFRSPKPRSPKRMATPQTGHIPGVLARATGLLAVQQKFYKSTSIKPSSHAPLRLLFRIRLHLPPLLPAQDGTTNKSSWLSELGWVKAKPQGCLFCGRLEGAVLFSWFCVTTFFFFRCRTFAAWLKDAVELCRSRGALCLKRVFAVSSTRSPLPDMLEVTQNAVRIPEAAARAPKTRGNCVFCSATLGAIQNTDTMFDRYCDPS